MTCLQCKFFVALMANGSQGECSFNPPTAILAMIPEPIVRGMSTRNQPKPISFRPPVPGSYQACGRFEPVAS